MKHKWESPLLDLLHGAFHGSLVWLAGLGLGFLFAELLDSRRGRLQDESDARFTDEQLAERRALWAAWSEAQQSFRHVLSQQLDHGEKMLAVEQGTNQAAAHELAILRASLSQREMRAQQQQQRVDELEQLLAQANLAWERLVTEQEQLAAELQATRSQLQNGARAPSFHRSKSQTTPARRSASANAVTGGDDLRRIEGVGPVLEEWLRGQGVRDFLQIANWSDEEVVRLGQKMPRLRARVLRDDWRRQAQRLYEEKYGVNASVE